MNKEEFTKMRQTLQMMAANHFHQKNSKRYKEIINDAGAFKKQVEAAMTEAFACVMAKGSQLFTISNAATLVSFEAFFELGKIRILGKNELEKYLDLPPNGKNNGNKAKRSAELVILPEQISNVNNKAHGWFIWATPDPDLIPARKDFLSVCSTSDDFPWESVSGYDFLDRLNEGKTENLKTWGQGINEEDGDLVHMLILLAWHLYHEKN